jgi:hypothetical protein
MIEQPLDNSLIATRISVKFEDAFFKAVAIHYRISSLHLVLFLEEVLDARLSFFSEARDIAVFFHVDLVL